ncbi:hypothetical protein AB0K04_05300 [Micromonospora coxensis]|uniref:hypothetical protein n=1 Tax=Micromonospora coxensis TaxID=356852 RepID=UPI00342385EA
MTGSSRQRRIAGAAALTVTAAAAFAVATGTGQASENCQGLDAALRNNLTFIAGQRQDPDANSPARIANRQAVVDLIEQRRAAAGCDGRIDVAGAVCPAVPWEVAMSARLDQAWAVTEQMSAERNGRLTDPQLTEARVKRLGGIFGGIRDIVQGARQAQGAAAADGGAANAGGADSAAPGGAGAAGGGAGRAAGIIAAVGGLIGQIAGIVDAARQRDHAAPPGADQQAAEQGGADQTGAGQQGADQAEADQQAGDADQAGGAQAGGVNGRLADRLQQIRARIQQLRAIAQQVREARQAARDQRAQDRNAGPGQDTAPGQDAGQGQDAAQGQDEVPPGGASTAGENGAGDGSGAVYQVPDPRVPGCGDAAATPGANDTGASGTGANGTGADAGAGALTGSRTG